MTMTKIIGLMSKAKTFYFFICNYHKINLHAFTVNLCIQQSIKIKILNDRPTDSQAPKNSI